MKHIATLEALATIILVGLVVLLLNPSNLWMPQPVQMSALAGVVVVFLVFASFVWREGALDEREAAHRNFAGRVAYLSGVSVMMAGIIIQSTRHNLDSWLVISLLVMVVAKLVAVYYSRAKR